MSAALFVCPQYALLDQHQQCNVSAACAWSPGDCSGWVQLQLATVHFLTSAVCLTNIKETFEGRLQGWFRAVYCRVFHSEVQYTVKHTK